MVELTTLAAQLEAALNENEYGIKFDVKADRNKYLSEQRKPGEYIVPGVLTALSGNYEPLQGIKVHYMPINLELWGYTGLHSLVPFTLEQQKECVQKVVEGLNGTTQEIGGDTVIFTGAVVTVGGIAQGADDVRIPILVQMQLTVVEKAVLANDVVVEIDGFTLIPISFSVTKEKTGAAQTKFGTNTAKTINQQQVRVFSGSCYLTEYDNNENSLMKIFENELLDDIAQNTTHTLIYRGRSYTVTFQSIGEVVQMGGIVMLSFACAEF